MGSPLFFSGLAVWLIPLAESHTENTLAGQLLRGLRSQKARALEKEKEEMASSSIPREGKPLSAGPIYSSHRGGRLPWQLEVPHLPFTTYNKQITSQLVVMQHPELDSLWGLTRGHGSPHLRPGTHPCLAPQASIVQDQESQCEDNFSPTTTGRQGRIWLFPEMVLGGGKDCPSIWRVCLHPRHFLQCWKERGASSWGTPPPQLQPLWLPHHQLQPFPAPQWPP